MERKSKQRGSTLKKLSFEFRNQEVPDPITVERDSETLLFEHRTDEEAREGVSSLGKLVDLMRREFPRGVRYTEVADVASQAFGVTKRRITELLQEGIEKGLVAKEKGRVGKYYVL